MKFVLSVELYMAYFRTFVVGDDEYQLSVVPEHDVPEKVNVFGSENPDGGENKNVLLLPSDEEFKLVIAELAVIAVVGADVTLDT